MRAAAFRRGHGNEDDGGGHLPERERERGAGLGWLRALAGVVGGWAGCWAGLAASPSPFLFLFFFLKTFSFPFLVFEELEKAKVFGVIFMELIFIKQPFQKVQLSKLFGSENFQNLVMFEFKFEFAKMV